ncbi:MAG: hypothetical protein LQ339_002042 [Xanthoria mediterranea]|nr:MAG: hypothetical protein LQ339_002042 [Xanthoria mediterranea]
MNIFAFCVVLLSLSFRASTLAHSRPRGTISNRVQSLDPLSPAKNTGSEVTRLRVARWPPCPYMQWIPRRKGDQYLLVTQNDRLDHGERARILAVGVCAQMIEWLRKLPQGTVINKRHWEHKSYGDSHVAEEISVFLDLNPPDIDTDPDAGFLDRELAFFAFEEYRLMLTRFGAMVGDFEIHAHAYKRAACSMHIVPWPADGNAGTRRITAS